MKKIKFILILVALTLSVSSFAQLNPVKDLQWQHWYSMPYNFYELSWTKPDTSLTDTLVGYMIYSDNQLYRFYTETMASHTIPQDTSFGGENFILFAGSSFIHVTAVYNSNQVESAYNDSAWCGGLLIGVDNLEKEIIDIYPNPINDNSFIHIKSPDGQIKYFTICSSSGQIIKKQYVNSYETFIRVGDLNLKHGLHLLMVSGDNYSASKKLIKLE